MLHADYEIQRNGKNIIYILYSSQVFNNGNTISIKTNEGENNFKIKKSKIYLDGGLLFGKYELVNENYEIDRISNEKIKGNVIEGIVEKVYEKNDIAKIGDNVVNKATNNLIIASDDYLGLEAIGKTDFYASQIDMVGKEKEITIESKSDLRMKGKKIHSN